MVVVVEVSGLQEELEQVEVEPVEAAVEAAQVLRGTMVEIRGFLDLPEEEEALEVPVEIPVAVEGGRVVLVFPYGGII